MTIHLWWISSARLAHYSKHRTHPSAVPAGVLSASAVAIGSNPEWTRRHRLHPCIDWIFQFQHSNIVTDGMETYIELKSTVSDCIIVPLIKGCDQQPAALIEWDFFSVIVVMMFPSANSEFYRLNVWFLAMQPLEHLLSYKLGIVRCCLTMPSQTVENRTHMIIAFKSFSI